jgi:tRNA pseudouridine38-40 synthase
VQGTLTDALSETLGFAVRLLFASRTDRGVHATHNVAMLTADRLPFAAEKLADVLNDRLPRDLVVAESREVPRGFHPRYFADRREYVYRIFRGTRPDIRYSRFAAHHPQPLDVPAMKLASELFLGEHDFTEFSCRDKALKDPVCKVHRCEVAERRKLLTVAVSATRFLRRMVCLMVGALVDVGSGRATPVHIADALTGKKHPAFTNVPGHGLTLTGVHYPEHVWYEGFTEGALDAQDIGNDDE